jgi:hypothetical protein
MEPVVSAEARPPTPQALVHAEVTRRGRTHEWSRVKLLVANTETSLAPS